MFNALVMYKAKHTIGGSMAMVACLIQVPRHLNNICMFYKTIEPRQVKFYSMNT